MNQHNHMHYEYRSRTQAPISGLSPASLAIRALGVKKTKSMIENGATNIKNGVMSSEDARDMQRHLIATLNYSVSQVKKELAMRAKRR